jgi:hypothetical protein
MWSNSIYKNICAVRHGDKMKNLECVGSKCQRTISTQKLKLLGEVPMYDLYYSLTSSLSESLLGLKLAHAHITLCLIFIK